MAIDEVEAAGTEVDDEAVAPVSSSSSSHSRSSAVDVVSSSSSSPSHSSSSSSPLVPADADPVTVPFPVSPPSAPAARILAVASLSESHAILVPGLLTRGRATHTVPLAHGVKVHLPPTHCANDVSTQACSPSKGVSNRESHSQLRNHAPLHASPFFKPANWALSFCASIPFCLLKSVVDVVESSWPSWRMSSAGVGAPYTRIGARMGAKTVRTTKQSKNLEILKDIVCKSE